MVRPIHDLQLALLHSTAFAAASAAAVPLLLPSLPPEPRALPLPLPHFCAALAVQAVIVHGLLGFAGLRLARARGLEPAPPPRWSCAAIAFVFHFGGWREAPPISWAWLIALNGLLGVALGAVFLRQGIVGAVLAPVGTDVVWHVAAQLP